MLFHFGLLAGVEGVAEALADEDGQEHDGEEGDGGKEDEPPRPAEHAGLLEEFAPARGERWQAKAEEVERGERADRADEAEGEERDEGR